jgi:hypothetical protein
MTDPALRITYGRKVATTVALAATEHGMSVKAMATTLERMGLGPLPRADDPTQPARLDGRTLLYDQREITKRLAARPGRGANLRGHG